MVGAALASIRSWPHSLQNLPVVGVIAPHFGQLNSITAPHSMQNLASSGFSVWHFGHFIVIQARQNYVLISGGDIVDERGAVVNSCSLVVTENATP